MAAGGFAALTGRSTKAVLLAKVQPLLGYERIRDAGNKWPLIGSYFLILAVLGWHSGSMQSKRFAL